jgi:hypothetical protein
MLLTFDPNDELNRRSINTQPHGMRILELVGDVMQSFRRKNYNNLMVSNDVQARQEKTPVSEHEQEYRSLQSGFGDKWGEITTANTAFAQNDDFMDMNQEYVPPTQEQEEPDNENHDINPADVPPGCDYTFDHGDTVFIDEISCPNWCGPGNNFVYTITTICAGNDCEAFDDCRISGCNDDCGSQTNDCPCATLDFDEVCVATCPSPTSAPTPAPTLAPTPEPTSSPTAAPVTPESPTPAPVLRPTPSPTLPPVADTAQPAPAPTTGATSTPTAATTTSTPTTGPTASLSTSEPTITPTMGPMAAPVRQKVNIVSTIFTNNKQGLPLSEKSRGIITTGSGFNDIEISWSEFNSNEFATEMVSTACLP